MRSRLLVFLTLLLASIFAPAARAVDTIVHNFGNDDGAPAIYGSLVRSGTVLYGMTGNGGSEFVGTIFSVGTDGSNYSVLHTFTNDGLASDGSSPLGSLIVAGNVLYGMTSAGGIVPPSGPPANGGTVFRINPDGSGFQVLHGFTGSQLTGSNDGGTPYGSVVVSGSTLYGMTRFGGTAGAGTVFSMNADGTAFTLLHSFTGSTNDGGNPQGSLTLIGSTLYGMTNGGGTNGEGTIFKINTDGSGFALLYSFDVFGNGDADEPVGDNSLTVVESSLYGMTFYGGANGAGAIFSINTDGTHYQIVHSLSTTDGAGPYGSLALAGSQLYGFTTGFGSSLGTVFSMTPDGSVFTVIHSFAGSPSDGLFAVGNPALSADGSTLYGMTEYGGSIPNGTVFSAPASGPTTNSNLASFLLSAGSLTPDFASGTTRYTATVSDTTDSVTVTPLAADPAASVTVNGTAVAYGTASAAIALNTGTNVIDMIVTAEDGVTVSIYTITVLRLTNLQYWRLTNLGTTASVGAAADDADYDASGISNLAKYAFGLDPTSPASDQIPQPALSGSTFGLTFTEPAGISGIQYGAEWTISLNPPAWTPVTDAGSGMTHIFNIPTGSFPSLFMRLVVAVPLSPIEQLGKDIFFDNTLSDPQGMACVTCHSPSAGFTGPDSSVNLSAGPVAGIVSGRFGHRKPQAIAYSTYSPSGPYFDSSLQEWIGGNFWDGRTPDNAHQARMPFLDADEMANTPTGPYPPFAGGYSSLVVQKLSGRPYASLFCQVFGAGVFQNSSQSAVYAMATQAIAAYEASAEVNPFSSKYDASANAVPPSNAYQFNASEQNGMDLFFGKALCSACHSSVSLDSVSSVTNGREVFTMYCFANIGVPKNPNNPYYQETDSADNPEGYNASGTAFIDYGLGSNPNSAPGGATFYFSTPGDNAAVRGLFKAPSLRNVDLRPSPNFVKAYMHNGVFKSLAEVVHFYNKRNIAVDASGDEIAFDLRVGPPSGYTPLFAPPEVLDNVQNVAGLPPNQPPDGGGTSGAGGQPPDAGNISVATNGQVGNLGLTPQEEADLVCFLKTLTDGFVPAVSGAILPNPLDTQITFVAH